MNKAILLLLMGLFVTPAFGSTKSDVLQLIRTIRQEVKSNVDLTEETLDDAVVVLEDVLEILSENSGSLNNCTVFVSDEYKNEGFGLDYSLKKAKDLCGQFKSTPVADVGFLKYVYGLFKKDGFATSYCFKKGVDASKKLNSKSQISCVKKITKDYKDQGYGTDIALRKGLEFCK